MFNSNKSPYCVCGLESLVEKKTDTYYGSHAYNVDQVKLCKKVIDSAYTEAYKDFIESNFFGSTYTPRGPVWMQGDGSWIEIRKMHSIHLKRAYKVCMRRVGSGNEKVTDKESIYNLLKEINKRGLISYD